MYTYLMVKERQIKTLHFSFSGLVNRWKLYSSGWTSGNTSYWRYLLGSDYLQEEMCGTSLLPFFKTRLGKALNLPSWRTPARKVLQLLLQFILLSHEGPVVFSVYSGPEVLIKKFSLEPRNDNDLETCEEVIEIGLEL